MVEQALALPDIDAARLPHVYLHAREALSSCSRIDECQDWADKAEALASYAKQSHDDTLHKLADRIQARAIRRAGELLKQIAAHAICTRARRCRRAPELMSARTGRTRPKRWPRTPSNPTMTRCTSWRIGFRRGRFGGPASC